LVVETEKLVVEVARDLGINAGTLANWVNAWRQENQGSEQPVSLSERARVADMEDEIRRLRMETSS
jgi:transposase-like protein